MSGKIQPTASFCKAHEVRMVFIFLSDEKNQEYFVTCENYIILKFQCSKIKSYWNTARHILFCTMCGFFHAISTEFNTCNRDHMAYKVQNIYIFDPLWKKFAVLWYNKSPRSSRYLFWSKTACV